MITVNGINQYSVDEQLEFIRETIQTSKVMGFVIHANVIQHYLNGAPMLPILCLFAECKPTRVKNDKNMPVFPLFFDHFVCEALMERKLADIERCDQQQDIQRHWLKFTETWVKL